METESFRVSVCSYDPNAHLECHSHIEPCIFIMLDGHMCENDSMVFTPGLAGYHPSDFLHDATIGETGSRILNISLRPNWFAKSAPRELLRGFTLSANRIVYYLAVQLNSIDSNPSPCRIEQLICQMIPLLLASGLQALTHNSRLFEMQQHFQEKGAEKITVMELAKSLGVHPGHLSRQFRQDFGCSLSTFLQLKRLEKACVALLESDAPLCQIAGQCGFFDQSHLTVSMKKYLFATPLQFRQASLSI